MQVLRLPVIGLKTFGHAPTRDEYDSLVDATIRYRLRLVTLIGAGIFTSFSALDFLTYPALAWDFLLIRLVVAAIMLSAALSTFVDRIHIPFVWLTDIAVVATCGGIALMIARSDGVLSAYDEGMNVVLLAMVTINSFRSGHNLAVGAVAIAMFLAAILVNPRPITSAEIGPSLFFLGGTVFFVAFMTRLYGRQHREQYEANRRLKANEQLKDQFFANVSHELRTPLTLLLGTLRRHLQQRATGTGATDFDDLLVAERNAATLLKQVNQLLDLSKLEAAKMTLDYTEFDLVNCVRFVASHFDAAAAEKHVEIALELPATMPLQADRQKIERILFNLLSNACKFVPSNGHVVITVRRRGDDVEIVVRDDGLGVPEPMRRAIFERFQQADGGVTRRFGGTGLGLAIVAEFVELLRGSVEVVPTVPHGAEFRVRLPLRAPAGVPVARDHVPHGEPALTLADESRIERELLTITRETATSERSAPETSPRVLVVEDNQEMRWFILGTLAPLACVEGSSDGFAALVKAAEIVPDLIITDIMMPGMSGERLVAELRNDPRLRDIPVMVLTAKADDELKDRLLREGCSDYLAKPFSADELLSRARNLIEMKRVRDALADDLSRSRSGLAEAASALAASRREALTALEAAKVAGRAKDEFLMVLSHELRTPLTSIVGWSDYLSVAEATKEDQRTAAEAVLRNSHALLRMVNDLLDLSRVVQGKLTLQLQSVPIAKMIADAVQATSISAQNKGIELTHDAAVSLGSVQADPDRLQQILWGLLNNAVKFTPAGGTINVSARRAPGTVMLAVKDSGRGIAPDFLPHVFDRLTQEDSSPSRRYGGLGLGLAIARHLVELHGGRIEAESEGLDRGATFRVFLPAKDL